MTETHDLLARLAVLEFALTRMVQDLVVMAGPMREGDVAQGLSAAAEAFRRATDPNSSPSARA